MKKTLAMLFLLFLVSFSASAEVSIKAVKYPELTSLVRNYKGKVILVDFWRHD